MIPYAPQIPTHHRRYLMIAGSLVTILLTLTLCVCFYIMYRLPNPYDLKSVQLPLPMRIYTQKGELMAEFGNRRHQFIKIDEAPPLLLKAFSATEDQRFWVHHGIDLHALFRALFEFVVTGQKNQGGSTITMQVARNFYLSREKTFGRKFKEILLALKIERALDKKEILELYLNKIYMGNQAIGVSAAAQLYFSKTLPELNLAEIALLAGLPKAPSLINPIANPNAAKKRRDFVLRRMFSLSFISEEDYQKALQEPILTVTPELASLRLLAPYVSDMAREKVCQSFGVESDMKGYHVYTTIDSDMQVIAENAVRTTLLEYDQRHGYRGPEKHLSPINLDNLSLILDTLQSLPEYNTLVPGIVVELDEDTLTVLLGNGLPVIITRKGWEWITTEQKTQLNDFLKPGDIVRVQNSEEAWSLTQVPQVQAALVGLDPKTGAIKSLSGGFSYALSQFNRATRASRQPGSAFKPFIYATALTKGYTLADVFNDAPLSFDMPDKTELWRPQNVTHSFGGLTRLRVALVSSINLVTVRVLQAVGIPYALNYTERFGFDARKWPRNLSLALGSGEVSPLSMAQGYAVFANGGCRVTPYLIDRITDAKGHLLYQAQPKTVDIPKDESHVSSKFSLWNPSSIQRAPRVISKEVAFLITSVLKDVTRYGTGQAIQSLKRSDLAGKTGTTNDRVDSWFIGFNSDLVCSVWVGFDQPRSLYEYAYTVALPLWIKFMGQALLGQSEQSLAQPKNIQSFYIHPETGLRVSKRTSGAVKEYFHITQDEKNNIPPNQNNHLLNNPLF